MKQTEYIHITKKDVSGKLIELQAIKYKKFYTVIFD